MGAQCTASTSDLETQRERAKKAEDLTSSLQQRVHKLTHELQTQAEKLAALAGGDKARRQLERDVAVAQSQVASLTLERDGLAVRLAESQAQAAGRAETALQLDKANHLLAEVMTQRDQLVGRIAEVRMAEWSLPLWLLSCVSTSLLSWLVVERVVIPAARVVTGKDGGGTSSCQDSFFQEAMIILSISAF